MLNVLPESRRASRRATRSGVISVAVHGALVAAVAYASGAEPPPPPPAVPDTVIHFQPPLDVPQRPRRPEAPVRADVEADRFAPATMPPTAPVDPGIVPEGIPPIDVPLGPVFARDSAHISVIGSPAAVNGKATGPGAQLRNEYADRPALALADNPAPRYPEPLRTAAVSGSVVMRFIIDTTGRVRMATLQALRSDHELFTAAVRAALPRMRFLAAEDNGRRVPVLVEQRFEFRLEP